MTYTYTILKYKLVNINFHSAERCPGNLPHITSKMLCSTSYSIATEEKVSFSPGWDSFSNNTDVVSIGNSFRYKTSKELNGSTFWGTRHHYSGGGYVANLGNTKLEASTLIANLKKYKWIDDYTAAIFVEFSTYNANTGLFNLVMLVLEFVGGGGVVPQANIDSVQLYRYNGANGVFSLLTEISCLIFITVITAMEIRRLVHEKAHYFSCGWNWIQFITILFFLIAMSMYAIRSVMTQRLITIMMNNRGNY